MTPPLAFAGLVTPVACGVRAYGELLAAALRGRGWTVAETWIPSDMVTTGSVLPAMAALLGRAWRIPAGTVVVWHYAAVGYTFRGISMPGVLFGTLCALRGLKVVTIVHEPGVDRMPVETIRYRLQMLSQSAALRRVVRSSRAVLVTTERRRARLKQLFGITAAVAPVFSNLPSGAGEPAPGVPGRHRVGVFGFGAPNARPEIVLGALKDLALESLEIVMAGAPGATSRPGAAWTEAARKFGLDGQLSFSGILPIDALGRVLAGCDVVVLPYDEGPNGRKGTLSGVLGLGCAVLALDGPERWDAVAESAAVCLVAADRAAVAAGLSSLLHDPASRDALRERARSFYDRHLTIDATVATLVDLVVA